MSKWRQIREWRKKHPREDEPPPEAIPPLLPTLVKSIPQGDQWLHEVKWDGYRIGIYLADGQARIYTRNLLKGAIWTRPEIAVEVEYRGWTEAEQHLRHPSYKGIREDRSAAEFGIEQSEDARNGRD